jgi:hypothetical protein
MAFYSPQKGNMKLEKTVAWGVLMFWDCRELPSYHGFLCNLMLAIQNDGYDELTYLLISLYYTGIRKKAHAFALTAQNAVVSLGINHAD